MRELRPTQNELLAADFLIVGERGHQQDVRLEIQARVEMVYVTSFEPDETRQPLLQKTMSARAGLTIPFASRANMRRVWVELFLASAVDELVDALVALLPDSLVT